MEPMSHWVTVSSSNNRSLGRLFCLPYAGGCASAYSSWKRLILPDIDIIRIHLPGRENRLSEPPFTCLASLVETLVKELIIWMDRPFAIFGHSLGALLAFELARELRRRNHLLPSHLFVSGYRAPHLPLPEPPFSHLPDKDFIDRVRQYGGISDLEAQNEEIMEVFLPILKADFEMAEKYFYIDESPLEFPVTVFGGLADPKIGCEKLEAWQIHTSSFFSLHFFQGGHFFIRSAESLVIDQINLRLTQSLFPH